MNLTFEKNFSQKKSLSGKLRSRINKAKPKKAKRLFATWREITAKHCAKSSDLLFAPKTTVTPVLIFWFRLCGFHWESSGEHQEGTRRVQGKQKEIARRAQGSGRDLI